MGAPGGDEEFRIRGKVALACSQKVGGKNLSSKPGSCARLRNPVKEMVIWTHGRTSVEAHARQTSHKYVVRCMFHRSQHPSVHQRLRGCAFVHVSVLDWLEIELELVLELELGLGTSHSGASRGKSPQNNCCPSSVHGKIHDHKVGGTPSCTAKQQKAPEQSLAHGSVARLPPGRASNDAQERLCLVLRPHTCLLCKSSPATHALFC